MKVLKIGAVALLAGGISMGAAVLSQHWMDNPGSPRTVGDGSTGLHTLPDFRLKDVHGVERSSAAWAGKVLVLNFWASWCPPCIDEIPMLVDAQKNYGHRGVHVVGVAVDRLDDVEKFLANHPVNYPVLIATPEALEIARRLGNRVGGLPYTVIFDRRGRRVFSQLGQLTREELDAQLAALAGNSTSGS